jgi:hypothetical protein
MIINEKVIKKSFKFVRSLILNPTNFSTKKTHKLERTLKS